MSENISEQLLNTVVKAASSKTKSGFEQSGIWIDWNLNEGVLKGHFSIPVKKMVDSSKSTVTIVAEDFLSYLQD